MKRDRTADYQRGNAEAARIILDGDPQTFGAGLVTWARLVLGRTEQKPRQTGEQMALEFERTEAA